MYQIVASKLGWRTSWLLAGFLAGCSPTDNWRELSWPDGQVAARFPCKPTSFEHAQGTLVQCAHRDVNFALAWQRVSNPENARTSLREVVVRFEQKTAAVAARQLDGPPLGALAWSESGHYVLHNARETVHLLVWARGLTVYQATVFGPANAAPLKEGVAALFVAGVRSLP